MSSDEPIRYDACLDDLRRSTAPSPERVERVRSRLDLQLLPATAELSTLPDVPIRSVHRVKARLQQDAQRTGLGWGNMGRWPVIATGVLVAGAAAAMVAVNVGPAEKDPIARALAGTGRDLALSQHVVASHDGSGRAVVSGEHVVIDWEIGQIDLAIAPDRRSDLSVRTSEGTVQATASAFHVERNALGTALTVDRGEAVFTCVDAIPRTIGAGQTAECWPTTGAGLLGRARLLEGNDAEPSAVLRTVDAALRAEQADAVRGELLAMKAGVLVDLDDDAGALDAAERAIEATTDRARIEALRHMAVRLALLEGECDRARAHADAVSATAEERALLDACR